MKINGVTVTPPSEEMLVIQRGEDFLVFKVRSLPDMDEFYKLCPEPEVPGVFDAKGNFEPDLKDKSYQAMVASHRMRRLSYMVVKSLEPSNIEWEKVDVNKPKTWDLWQEELREAGLTNPEVNALFDLVISANTLSEDKMKKAREAFLAGQARASEDTSGHLTEQPSTPSGTPASESESDPQE